MSVSDWSHEADSVSVRLETTVRDAIDIMVRRNLTWLPVVDAEGKLLGAVTDSLLRVVSYHPEIRHNPVRRYITEDVVTGRSDGTADDLVEVFLSQPVRHLAVVDDDKLVGIVYRREMIDLIWQRIEASDGASPGRFQR